MKRHYKVIKENFLRDVGAILEEFTEHDGNVGFSPIDTIYCKHEKHTNEYVSSVIVENSPEYFQRVYAVNLLTKTVYKAKEQAKEMLEKQYKE